MKLQTATRIGLYAVLELAAKPNDKISGSDIAEKFAVSNNHLAKVMRRLVVAGLARAVRGVNGGYQFSGNPKRTTLMDVIQLFELLEESPPSGAPRVSTEAEKALDTVLREIDQTIQATFYSISISTMLNIMNRQKQAPTS